MQSVVEPIKISDSEWEVMRVIWTLGQSDAKEITALLSENKKLESSDGQDAFRTTRQKRRIENRKPRKKICLFAACFRRSNRSQRS